MDKLLDGISEMHIEYFQQSRIPPSYSIVNEETIEDIWRAFTESNRSMDGKINKAQMQKVFLNKLALTKKRNRLCILNEHIVSALFERFKSDRGDQFDSDKKIDIQELVISLAILARISQREKLLRT